MRPISFPMMTACRALQAMKVLRKDCNRSPWMVSVKWWKIVEATYQRVLQLVVSPFNCLLSCFQLGFWLGHVIAAIDAAQNDLTAAQEAVQQ